MTTFLGALLFGLATGTMAWAILCVIALITKQNKWEFGHAPKWFWRSWWVITSIAFVGWLVYGISFLE